MKEYIERAALKRELAPYEENDFSQQMDVMLAIVDAQPAADVVEVVRCKNCRFFSGRQECYCHAADENGTPIFVREDDFCSYGSRMDKEDEHEAD